MAYDPEMGGDTALVLSLANCMFGGHIRRDAVLVEKYDRRKMPWVGRCNLVMLLYPDCRTSRCGIVDLLDPREWDKPRCGDPRCRCMDLEAAKRHDLLQFYRFDPPQPPARTKGGCDA